MGSSKKLEIANAEKKQQRPRPSGNKAILSFMYSKSIRSESSRKTKLSPKSLVKMGLPDEDEVLLADPKYKSYAAQIDKCLKSFEYSTEWPDLISALSKLNKVIGSCKQKVVPKKFLVSKRLSQCLHPALPAGVHLKALEAYDLVFTSLGPSGLSVNLHIFSPGLFPLYPHALIGVRSPLLSLYERHFLPLGSALRPALEGFLISILSGMEEGSDFYERARELIERVGEENELEPLLWVIAERVRSARLAALRLLLHRSSRLTMGPIERNALLMTLGDDELLTARVSLELISLLFPLDGLASEDAKVELLSAALALLLRRDLSLNRRFFGWLLGDKEGFFPNVSRGLLLKAARASLNSDPNAFRILTYLMDKEEVDVGEELLPDVVRQMAKNETPKDAAGLFFSTFPPDFLTSFAGNLLIGNNNDEPDEGKKTFNQEDDAVELVDFLLTKDLLCPRRLFNLLVELPPQPKFVILFERLFHLAPSPLDFSGFPAYYSRFVGKALGKEVDEIFSTLETKGPEPLEEDFNFDAERDRPPLKDSAEELKVDPLLAPLVPILNQGVLVAGGGENLRPLAALCLARHKNSLSTFLSSPSDPLLVLFLRNNTHFFEKVSRWLWERAEVELLQGLHVVSPYEVERTVASRRDTRRLKVLLNAGRGMPKGASNFDRAIFHVINDDSVDGREFVKDTLNLQDGSLLFDPPLFALLNNLGKSEPIIQTPNDNLSVNHIGWDEGGGGGGEGKADVYDSVSVSELDLRVNYSRGELSASFPPSSSPTRRIQSASCEAIHNAGLENLSISGDVTDRAVSLQLPLRVPYPDGLEKIEVREIPSPTNVSSSYSSGTEDRPKPIHPFHTHLRTYLMSYDEALVLHALDGLEKLIKFPQTASALVQTKLEHSPRADSFDKPFPSDFTIGAKSKTYAQVFLEILINLGITYYGTENSITDEDREANFQVQIKAWSLAGDILEKMEAQHACILGTPLERRTLLSLIAILEFDPNNVETWTEEILAASPHNYEAIHEQILRLTTILVKADRKPKGPANHDVLKFLPGLALSSQPLYLKAVSSGLSGVRWTVWGLWLDSLADILPHLGADLSPVILPSLLLVGKALVGPPPSEDFPERAIVFLANVTSFLLGHMEEAAVKASSFYSLIFSSGTAKTPTAESDDPRALAKADFFGKFHILLWKLSILDAYTTARVKSRIRAYLSPVVESHTDKFVWSLCLVEGDPSNLLADLLPLDKFTASLSGLLKNLNKLQQENGLHLLRELVERQEKVECVPPILGLVREMNAGGQALNTAPPAVRLLTQLVVHVGSGKTELKEFQEVASKVLETLSRKGGDVKILTENLDLVNCWGQEEKEKLLPLLASVVYNLTPNLKKGGEPQKATTRFFEKLSNFSYTRKAWKKELFEHLVDIGFFKIDVESLRIWNTTLENLFSQESTFAELIARVNVSVTTLNYFSSKEVEWESRASLIKRLAFVIFSSRKDTFVKFVQNIQERLAEALKTQVPLIQSAVFLCFRVLLLRFSPSHLQALWPIIVFEVLQILSMDAELFERGGESRVLYLSVEKLLCLCETLPPQTLPIFQMYRWAFVSRRRILDPGPDPAADLEADFLENP